MPSLKIIRYLVPLIIVVFFLLAQTPQFELPLMTSLERIAGDIRTRATLSNTIDDRIAIIDIDEASVVELGQWPWQRSVLTKMVNNLFNDYQISTLGFDMVFAEPERDYVRENLASMANGALSDNQQFLQIIAETMNQKTADEKFADSFKERNIVTGLVFSDSDSFYVNALPLGLADIPEEIADRLSLIKPNSYTANIPILDQQAKSSGFFDNNTVDSDGIFRRVPLIQLFENRIYPSLALAVTRTALDDLPYDIQLIEQGEYLAIEQFQLGSLIVPLDIQGAVQVPFNGFAGSFNYYSAADIINKTLDTDILKKRIVLIGTSAAGLQDLRSTPVGKNFPGVEIHANIISGILNQNIPAKPAWALSVNMIITLFSGLIMMLLVVRFSPVPAILATVILVGLILIANLIAWNHYFILNLVSPLACVFTIFVWQTTFGFLIETRNKRRITQQFGQYVPPDLVNEMVNSSESLSLEGESRNMTVLFSDVRGFTSLSEGLEPNQLTQLMNNLLTPLTRVIHEHRGTIDKYMGDAIMAFWGAPLQEKMHAHQAVCAALKLQESAQKMRADFEQQNLPPLHIGVGINTGEMSVGNMGSEFRMAYTVLGDAVNLGSRIEGLTRQYGVDILISESTNKAVSELICRKIDIVQVKGKNEPVAIYEPIGFKADLSQDLIDQVHQFNTFHELYCMQLWKEAEHILEQLSESHYFPNKQLFRLYQNRIEQYRVKPPEENWQGVFVHTSK